jgi:hypothetical protein
MAFFKMREVSEITSIKMCGKHFPYFLSEFFAIFIYWRTFQIQFVDLNGIYILCHLPVSFGSRMGEYAWFQWQQNTVQPSTGIIHIHIKNHRPLRTVLKNTNHIHDKSRRRINSGNFSLFSSNM